MSLKRPPVYGNVPAEALFASGLKREVCLTLARLHALAWQTKGDRTPPATIGAIAKECGVGERQMWREIAELRKKGWIKWESLGNNHYVVHPLRLGAAALATGDVTGSAEGSTVRDDSEVTVTDDSKPPVLNGRKRSNSTVTDDSKRRFQSASTVTDDSKPPGPASTVTDDSHVVLKHVVVSESDSDLKTEQQHDNQDSTVTDDSNSTDSNDSDLVQEIAEAFMVEGTSEKSAWAAAQRVMRLYGAERCRAQLPDYAYRCERARGTPRGLDTAVGLFFRSVEEDWEPEPEPQKTEKGGFTEEELRSFTR